MFKNHCTWPSELHQLTPVQLSDMAQIIERNHAFIEQIAYHIKTVSKQQADRDLAAPTALLKVSCTRGLERCNREALQILGGVGFQRGGRGGRVEQMSVIICSSKAPYGLKAGADHCLNTRAFRSRDLRVMAVGGGSDEIMTEMALVCNLHHGNAEMSGLTMRPFIDQKMGEQMARLRSKGKL